MAEQIIQIENVNPGELYGANDQNLSMVRSLFPKLKIIVRGDFVKVIGEDEEVEYFLSRFVMLVNHLERYGSVNAQVIEDIMLSANSDAVKSMDNDDVLVFGRNGLQIKALTVNQKRMVKACGSKDMVFAIGPAGTGKTYKTTAIALSVLGITDIDFTDHGKVMERYKSLQDKQIFFTTFQNLYNNFFDL